MTRGPVEVMVLTYPTGTDPVAIAATLSKPVKAGAVRLIDLVLILRGPGGQLVAIDAEEADGLPQAFAELVLDPHTLLSDDDVNLVAEALEEDFEAAVVAVEHVWAKGAVEDLARFDGQLALHVRVPAEDVDAAFAAAD